jgi:glyoxylase-like metal-dependent hydrolase (beta-lactamase superfamily II)
VREVGDGVFQLDAGGKLVNVFYVQADVPVLVDAGGPREAEALVEELLDEGAEPKLVLLTHGDFDHFGGAAVVREQFGAPIAAPTAERPLLTGEIDRRWFVQLMIRSVCRGRLPKPPTVDRWFESGEVVEGLEAIPTPGHTPGHTAFRFRRTLIAGDAVITGERFRPPVPMFCFDNDQTRRSIEKLAELDFDLAVCGHGPASRDASAKLRDLVATWGARR